jgi:hypothetical protein
MMLGLMELHYSYLIDALFQRTIFFLQTEWLKKGTNVDVNDLQSGLWFKGTVVKVHDDTVSITFASFAKVEMYTVSECKWKMCK